MKSVSKKTSVSFNLLYPHPPPFSLSVPSDYPDAEWDPVSSDNAN